MSSIMSVAAGSDSNPWERQMVYEPASAEGSTVSEAGISEAETTVKVSSREVWFPALSLTRRRKV